MPMTWSFRPLIPVLAASLLAACNTERGPDPADAAWQGVPPVFNVTTTDRSRVVFVTPGTGALTGAERANFEGLIRDAAAGDPGVVHLTFRSWAPPATLETLRRTAIADGIEPTKIELGAPDRRTPHVGGPGIAIEVVASTSRVNPPSCPHTTVENTMGNENMSSSNWGCAVVTNMDAQIADPRDLVQGESGGQTSGVLTSAAIDRLYADHTKPLPKLDTSQTSVGGS